MNLWNLKTLDPPPTTTYTTSTLLDIGKLRCYFKDAVEYFGRQTILEKEAALLSRCIYRMKMKFRSDKGLKFVEKLNHTLLQFNYLNLYNILENFFSLLPEDNDRDSHVPTRNMLDYVLVRIQGATYLMNRATEIAQTAADNMGSRLCIGQFWKVALIMLAVVSRIWIICKDIMKICCNFYNNILSMRTVLRNISNNWLPDDYVFPNSLEEWLHLDWNNTEDTLSFKSLKPKIPVVDVNEYSDVEEIGEYIEIKDENKIIDLVQSDDEHELENIKNKNEKLTVFEILTKNEDLGEVVCDAVKDQQENALNFVSSSEDDTCTSSVIHRLKVVEKKSKNLKMHKNLSKYETIKKIGKQKIQRVKLKQIEIQTPEHNEHIQISSNIVKNAAKSNKPLKYVKKKIKLSKYTIENINSLGELKMFMLNESKRRKSENAGIFCNLDKLQWVMLKKYVEKCIKKVRKDIITERKCLVRVKKLLHAKIS